MDKENTKPVTVGCLVAASAPFELCRRAAATVACGGESGVRGVALLLHHHGAVIRLTTVRQSS